MLNFGHNASLNLIDGVKVFDENPKSWGPLVPKAEYLAQFGSIKVWEIYVLAFQLRPLALEQLAQAIDQLSKHPLFANLDWLSFHFPTDPQSHRQTAEISQEKWQPFTQLLQVLDRFTGAKVKSLNFHVMTEISLAEVWQLNRKNELAMRLDAVKEEGKSLVNAAKTVRDQINPHLGLTVENNPPYHNKAHRFHLSGLFPAELRSWQEQGLDLCLDIQHASLVNWYRERYGYEGPIPPMNELHHRTSINEFAALNPLYLHLAGVPNTPESLHQGSTIGSGSDNVAWPEWLAELKPLTAKRNLPVIIELEDGHSPQNWPACQTSVEYLKKRL